MAVFQTSFLYELDENGNSQTGKVDSLIPNSSASAVEAIDDSIIQIGETFDINFPDPVANSIYGGTYTYIGHATPFSGFIAEAGGQYYMFSNDVIPIGTTLNGFTAEDIPVCFAEGTQILTPSGEVPVETLRAGDLVITPLASQRVQPLLWVGHRHMDCATARDRRAVVPVLLRAGALGPGVPVRDMRVSPEHAFLLDGRLVPARLLVDGIEIVQETWRPSVTYWHLELQSHGILVADGTFAESYFDDGNRQFFNNPGLVALRPGSDRTPGGRYAAHACAPPILDAADPALVSRLPRRRRMA
ncbi:Hint domain-containing protein [Roseomonas sp. CAU 1739]|uniref:Hint domain-containing protein n=1 Tax=Roseomonas sp. CAU 1739 TaxID=3140364 RepID=UPI00325B133F